MEPKIINQEILLFIGTTFCSRPFSKKNTNHDSCDNYSSMEELEKACWHGMLHALLPELVGNSIQRNNNYIWATVSGVNFLCVHMGPYPIQVEGQTSVDPYFFLHESGKAN